MPPEPRHFKDEIQDLLANRLDAQMRAEVEQHLQTCQECRREFEAMRWTRQIAATRVRGASAPSELRENILRAVRTSDRQSDTQILRPRFRLPKLTTALACAAVIMISGLLAIVLVLGRSSPTAVVAREFYNYKAQQLPLELKTADVKQMEAFFATHGVPFETRVFDLGMMKFQLLGGRVQRMRGAPSALFVYRGSPDQILICQMYTGKVTELPSGPVQPENKGIMFYVYSQRNPTMDFWH